MKICKKCGQLVSYNSYFDGYFCTCCGNLEHKHSTEVFRMQRSKQSMMALKNVPVKLSCK